MPATEQQQPVYQFGAFELDTANGILRKHGVKLKLQDQPRHILMLLLERPGETVSREEIQRRLWPENTYVNFDNAINSAVRKLRDALSDAPENPRFIETLSRRGYRFIAPVSRPAFKKALLEEPSSPIAIDASPRKRRLAWIGLAFVSAVVGLSAFFWFPRHDQTVGNTGPKPAVPLTGNSGFEAFPTISPEGTRVAYSWQKSPTEHPGIYVKLINQGEPIRLTNASQDDFAPAWSSDGRWIAFLRSLSDSRAAIIVIPSLGGQERQVAEIIQPDETRGHWKAYTVPPPFLAWSLDSQWLLAIEQKRPGFTYSIVRISVDSGEKRDLTSPSEQTNGDGGLALSPDGKTLAFTRTVGLSERDLYLLPVSSELLPVGKPTRLTFDNKEIDGLSWTSDGQSLAFSSKRGGRRELWQISAAVQAQPVQLTAAGDDPRHVIVSRTGNHLIYSHQVLDWDIWRTPLRAGKTDQGRRLISSTRVELLPKYSPDGSHIAFESSRSGNDEIWTAQADGSHAVQVTSLPNSWSGSPRWSPDGRQIAFDGNASGNWDIYVVSAAGGQPRRLTNSSSHEFRPSWSRDGRWIYYCSSKWGVPEVCKIPVRGGVEVRVTKHGGAVAYESVDGEDLYYTKDQSLWKMPVKGGDETRIIPSLFSENFAVLKRGIYFMEAGPSSNAPVRVRFLDFATRAVETVAMVYGPIGDEISISPDERWMLYQKNDHDSSELMLIENFR